ncbi:MAG: class I SAM-dependent methyltransferase [Rubrobacter sp.]|nr:class I SAM-dependent methyltransferase [Rubrobacter sp.]
MRRNYFTGQDVAERYARSRPYFHPLVVRKIARLLHLDEPVHAALDVACGTGRSCAALTEIASRVIGTDPSAEMLNQASRNGHIEYVEAPAEDLPFDAGAFDLVTVASAFHWFDRARFLSEARRVLHAAGWLVVYDNFFFGRMKENVEFEHWYRDRYLIRYPSPPRDRRPFTDEEVENHGFRFVEREEYANDILFSVEELACYLETQSNVIAAIEGGKDSLEEVHEWLVGSLTGFFRGSRATLEFGGHIWCLETSPIEVDQV